MKTVSLILAFLLLSLACYPCSDSESCADEKKNGQVVDVADHGHTSGEMDQCTPFCVCQCCNTHINEPTSFSFPSNIVNWKNTNSVLKDSFARSIHLSIWQPPKLG